MDIKNKDHERLDLSASSMDLEKEDLSAKSVELVQTA